MPDLNAVKKALLAYLKVEGEIPEGLHTFDQLCEVRVIGAAKKKPDSTMKATVRLPLLEILALAVKISGFQGARLLELIREAVQEAAADEAGRSIAEYLETTKKAMRQVEDELVAKMPPVKRAGSFTGQVEVELLSVRPLAEALKVFAEPELT